MEVSIVITCYNQEKYIARAIRSCLNQNFPTGEFEVIVVDDASSDHSTEIIADFGEKIVSIRNKKNLGLPASRNLGIRKALGRYVVSVDGDDYVLKDLIGIESLHLTLNAHWGGVSCDYITVGDDGLHIRRVSGIRDPIACGVMFRKDSMIMAGLYDEKMRVLEEKDFRLRYMKDHYIGHVELPLYRYRKHDSNITENRVIMSSYNKKLKRKHKIVKKKGTK